MPAVVFEWNDASVHPLGDIWLRTAPFGLGRLSKTVRVNDDASFAMHFMPAVSVRADGTICSSCTDKATDGVHTYFTWSDGRLGIPQPFVAVR